MVCHLLLWQLSSSWVLWSSRRKRRPQNNNENPKDSSSARESLYLRLDARIVIAMVRRGAVLAPSWLVNQPGAHGHLFWTASLIQSKQRSGSPSNTVPQS